MSYFGLGLLEKAIILNLSLFINLREHFHFNRHLIILSKNVMITPISEALCERSREELGGAMRSSEELSGAVRSREDCEEP